MVDVFASGRAAGKRCVGRSVGAGARCLTMCVCYTRNAFRPETRFGTSKRVSGSQIPKHISGRPKCISGRTSTRDAFRDDHANSEMKFASQMHLVITKCIRGRPKWLFILPH